MNKYKEIIITTLLISGCNSPIIKNTQENIKNKCVQLTKIIDEDTNIPKITCVGINEKGEGFINNYKIEINNNKNTAKFFLEENPDNFIVSNIINNGDGDCKVGKQL